MSSEVANLDRGTLFFLMNSSRFFRLALYVRCATERLEQAFGRFGLNCRRLRRLRELRYCPAFREFIHPSILHMRRMTGMRAATAECQQGAECLLWAVYFRT